MQLNRILRTAAVMALAVAGVELVRGATASDSVAPSPITAAPTTQPDTRMRSPQQEMATIVCPPGYHLELVASEPDVVCPVLCQWDGNGRMYVAEMRSYMLDLNGSKAHTRISRVSRWTQSKNNGVYDQHTVYADNLLLPRAILPLDDRILIRETDTKDLVSYRDTHHDGVADEKIKIYDGGVQEGNLEHQPAGLLWDLDNWIYLTAQTERFRFTRGQIEKASLPFRPGQWGMAMDDTGRLIYSTAGSERPAHNFQVMPQYGDIGLPDELAKDFTQVFPLEHLTDVEGGPKRLWPGGGLNRFTGCAGPSIFRGDALPADLKGDLIIPEPVGRLVRRAKVRDVDGKIVISSATDKSEFIASTDANFRPVWSATGPDGCLYLCDMYHGIIQEANWTRIGSYLRPQIRKYDLQNHKNAGRIFRLVYDGMKPRALPHMLDETPAQLLAHLSDPNGWWRDTAQKLIILKRDLLVVPELTALAESASDPIVRLQAYWTLEGLDVLDDSTTKHALADLDPRVRAAAIRMVEPRLSIANSPALATVQTLAGDADAGVAAQACLSLMYAHAPGSTAVVDSAMKPRSTRDDVSVALVNCYRANIAKAKKDEQRKLALKRDNPKLAAATTAGEQSYSQTCIACHGPNGMGMAAPERDGTTIAPPLRGSRHLLGDRDLACRIVLNGLTGPNCGTNYPGQMASFRWAQDQALANILTYARNSWGNQADLITAGDVANARQATAGRMGPYTLAEIFGTDQSLLTADRSPDDILLDPAHAQLNGDDLRLQAHPAGADIGFWSRSTDSISWMAAVKQPGVYTVIALTATPKGPNAFDVNVGGSKLHAAALQTASWGDFRQVIVGTTQIQTPGDVKVEIHPSPGQRWRPTNLAGIALVRTIPSITNGNASK